MLADERPSIIRVLRRAGVKEAIGADTHYRRHAAACRSAPVARSRKLAIWRLTVFASAIAAASRPCLSDRMSRSRGSRRQPASQFASCSSSGSQVKKDKAAELLDLLDVVVEEQVGCLVAGVAALPFVRGERADDDDFPGSEVECARGERAWLEFLEFLQLGQAGQFVSGSQLCSDVMHQRVDVERFVRADAYLVSYLGGEAFCLGLEAAPHGSACLLGFEGGLHVAQDVGQQRAGCGGECLCRAHVDGETRAFG